MVSASEEYVQSHPDITSITPLPSNYHSGLVAITIFALLSFILTSTLFIYLTYKLVAWHFYKRSRAARLANNIPQPRPLSELAFNYGDGQHQRQSSKVAHEERVNRIRAARDNPPNQFLILVFNLFLADMHQGAAFLLSARWIQKGGIFIEDPTCFVQGLFDSNGDLSSSFFITAIAVHTYLSVVKNYKPPQKILYAVIVTIWLVVYGLGLIPLWATKNGRNVGGFFVRAGAWCWINEAYENLRLLTHYLYIFISLVTTTTLYITIFFSLRRQAKEQSGKTGQDRSEVQLAHNPAFLIYPLIYVLCTLPLAVGRIATMAGAHVPIGYYCFAGTLIASNGSFDCLLFGLTRHTIVFGSSDDVDVENTGLETFAFMRTPTARFGNSVWIQGGDSRFQESSTGVGGWWHRLAGGSSSSATPGPKRARTLSQESLRSSRHNEMAIQMDVVTSIEVKVDPGKEQDPRYPKPSLSSNQSINSGEKVMAPRFGV